LIIVVRSPGGSLWLQAMWSEKMDPARSVLEAPWHMKLQQMAAWSCMKERVEVATCDAGTCWWNKHEARWSWIGGLGEGSVLTLFHSIRIPRRSHFYITCVSLRFHSDFKPLRHVDCTSSNFVSISLRCSLPGSGAGWLSKMMPAL